MNRSTFEVFHYRDDYMKEVALHHHDFYEIYFFQSGNVSYNIESRNYLLTPGDVLIISPNELHQPIFGEDRQNYERTVLWINKSFLEQFNIPGQEISRCFDTTQQQHTNLLRPDGVSRELLNYLLIALEQEMDSREYASGLYAMGLLAQLLVIINRMAERSGRESEPRANSDSVVYRVLGYINEHYNEELSLDFLANKFFISKYHLSREFARLVGTSVYRYIIQKRLVMAKQMMSAGMSTSEVYQHCGFGDYSNFYRAFKAEYQISPREFQESIRKENAEREERTKFLHEAREKL
jgi:AraC-like DNA-binding protein